MFPLSGSSGLLTANFPIWEALYRVFGDPAFTTQAVNDSNKTRPSTVFQPKCFEDGFGASSFRVIRHLRDACLFEGEGLPTPFGAPLELCGRRAEPEMALRSR